MPHLLSVWPSVRERLLAVSRVLVFLDYDGTLTPIVSRPELAELSPETRSLIRALNARDKFVVGIISGRELADLRGKVGVPDVIYAGNHGMEIEAGGEGYLHPEAEAGRDRLASVYQQLCDELGQFEGVILEDKGLTLSVHFRLTPESLVGEVEETFGKVVSDLDRFKVTQGKKVLEVRPNVEWDKGKAIAKIAEGYPQDTMSVFFGDDLTDEAGFEAVQNCGGFGVFVGPARQPTKALYRVDSPAEVAEALFLLSKL